MRPLTVGDPVFIGRYLLLGRLGAGGMGVVYLAEHPHGGLVALKTPHAVHLSDPTLRARFAEEVDYSRRVVPFCTAAPIEDGFDRERPYLVTEYIPGPALSHVVTAGGPLTPDLAYGVALGAAAALVATHDAGLVHRDLKPGNVLLSPRGPFVIDFGIARDVDAAVAHTQAGQIMGSPGWVAPERLSGGPAIPASDVFSWGCLVAFAATGRHPFGTGELDVLTRRILVEEPRISGVPKLLWDAVAAALAKDPAARPSSASLLSALLAAGGLTAAAEPRAAVAAVLEETWQPVPYPAAEPGPTVERDRRPPRRRRRGGGDHGRDHGRDGHVAHAGFAALATVTIAAMTVVAAGTGAARMQGTVDPPARPVVIPGEDGTMPPGGAPASSAPRYARGAERTAGAPGPRAWVTVTATRSASPPEDTPRSPWVSATLSPPPRGRGGVASASPPPDDESCLTARGRPRRCPPGQSGSPRPSASIGTEPQWGDGESPSPSPLPSVTAPDTSPAATATPTPAEAVGL
ncbi:protein kinase [Microbispora sp. RL4-1S]|uniref:Protein kinase n=1 Tax=Microbispora oryzae TaxID=2806554 RepID=A0A940WME3_9ACTN|nr:serine/threonine-protein kinase [Microbispora oryzae]MBP2703731.1 protein kinase [Microbispora oryzae]